MKLTKKFLSALLVCAAAVTMLCAAASATAAPVTAETPAQKQAVLDTINAVRQQNGLAPVAETADTDAQADRMAALYFSTDDGDAYDAQWLAILDTKVEGKVSIGDCYSYKLENGGWYTVTANVNIQYSTVYGKRGPVLAVSACIPAEEPEQELSLIHI